MRLAKLVEKEVQTRSHSQRLAYNGNRDGLGLTGTEGGLVGVVARKRPKGWRSPILPR